MFNHLFMSLFTVEPLSLPMTYSNHGSLFYWFPVFPVVSVTRLLFALGRVCLVHLTLNDLLPDTGISKTDFLLVYAYLISLSNTVFYFVPG